MKLNKVYALILAVVMVLSASVVALADNIVVVTTPINEVYVDGISVPVVGETPDFSANIDSDAGYKFIEFGGRGFVAWYCVDDEAYLTEDDVFESGKTYHLNIHLGVKDDYYFALNENDWYVVEAYINGEAVPEDAYSKLHGYTEQVAMGLTLAYVPLEKHEINIYNGFAIDESGMTVYSACAGEKITIIAEDYTNARTFCGWEIWYPDGGLGEDFDDTSEVSSFIMPDASVMVEAYYEDAQIDSVELSLLGYNVGASVNGLQVTASAGADILNPDGETKNYVLLSDNNGSVGEVVTGTIQANTIYWLGLRITSAEGYYIPELNSEQVSLGDVSTINVATSIDGGEWAVFARLPAATKADYANITVNGGGAYLNGEQVEKAVEGMTIELFADNPSIEGYVFKRWELVNGDAFLLDDCNSHTTFIMGKEDAVFKAVFGPRGGIELVEVNDVTVPEVGATPNFEVTVPEDAGYSVYEVDWKLIDANANTCNFVSLGKNYIFEEGKNYQIEVTLKADDSNNFRTNCYDDVLVLTRINGEPSGIPAFKYGNESAYEYVTASMVFYTETEQKAEINEIEFKLDNFYVGKHPNEMTLNSTNGGIVISDSNLFGTFGLFYQIDYGWIGFNGTSISNEEYKIVVSGYANDAYTLANLNYENVTLNGFVCSELEIDKENESFEAIFYAIPATNYMSYTVEGTIEYTGYNTWVSNNDAEETVWGSYDAYNYITVNVYKTTQPDKVYYKFTPRRDGRFKAFIPDGDYIFKTTLKTTKTTLELGKTTLDENGKTTLDNGKTTKTTLDNGKTTLDLGKTTLDNFVAVDFKTTLKTTAPVKTTLSLRRMGDVNADLDIDALDYLLIKRTCFNTYSPDELSALAGNINKDKTTDSLDYILVKRHCFGTYRV